jgi:hypothetical protein
MSRWRPIRAFRRIGCGQQIGEFGLGNPEQRWCCFDLGVQRSGDPGGAGPSAVQAEGAACTQGARRGHGHVADSGTEHLRIYQPETQSWKVRDLTRDERSQNVNHSSGYTFRVWSKWSSSS